MRPAALSILVLCAACGMMSRGPELSNPSVSALSQDADGTESVELSWPSGALTRDYLQRTTATSSGQWLAGTTVVSDQAIALRFGRGFSAAMAGQGPYTVSLAFPEQSSMGACPCCRHASHVVNVTLTFDERGAASSTVAQVVR